MMLHLFPPENQNSLELGKAKRDWPYLVVWGVTNDP